MLKQGENRGQSLLRGTCKVEMNENAPTEEAKQRHLFGHGRLSYIQIPAINVQASATFYAGVFGWEVKGGDDHHLSFTDATGDMIGAWVTGHAPLQEPGIIPYIYVHGIDAILQRIKASGGQIVKPVYTEGDLWVAIFRDPAGNMIGLWQKSEC
jgi:predicted enzyme related to lactoylglutathione lyase